MADIKKIAVPGGEYNIKDASAVQSVTAANGVLTVAKRDGTSSTIQLVDNTLTQAGRGADAKKTGELLNSKANVDGVYDDMTVGNAKHIQVDKYPEDKTPYLFRQTPVNAERENDCVVGGTVAWNQLVQNGNFADGMNGWTNRVSNTGNISVADGKLSVTLISVASYIEFGQNFNTVQGHKYLFSIGKITTPHTIGTVYMSLSGSASTNSTLINYVSTGNVAGVISATINASLMFVRAAVNSGGFAIDDVLQFENIQVFDLTLLFGSTIADHIYALEQAHAGDGVAFFRKLFPASYYPYDAGTLKSVEGLQSHDMTGFNIWDEEWKLGAIKLNDGTIITDSTRVRTKNYFNVLPSTNYYIHNSGINTLSAMIMFWYDSAKNYISYSYCGNTIVASPSNARYAMFYMGSVYGTTYNHDICINLSDPAKNGTYEPYVKHSYPLDDSLTLRGIPKLDASNNLYYDGDTYESNGVVTRRYGVVDLGTLTWYYSTNHGNYFNAHFVDVTGEASKILNVICTKYIPTSGIYTTDEDKAINCTGWRWNDGEINIWDSSYTDAATFKTAMSGVHLVYELATPTTETADEYHNPQICHPSGTEEYVTTGIVPVGHVTEYLNVEEKIERLPWDLSMIAPIEDGLTAARSYEVGEYFLHDDFLCKAKTAINVGDTFVLDTNYTVSNVVEEMDGGGSFDLSDRIAKGVDNQGTVVTGAVMEGSISGNNSNKASGSYSHAEGYQTTASGYCAHSEGYNTTSSSYLSHAEGGNTTASGDYSHAEGGSTTASQEYTHAEGVWTVASGYVAHAEGSGTIASGSFSHSEGQSTTANHRSQHVFGEFNEVDNSNASSYYRGNYVEIVGNGTDNSTRSNARTLDWSGNERLAGSLTLGAGTANEVTITAAQLSALLSLSSAQG